jgi:hypothetical protein
VSGDELLAQLLALSRREVADRVSPAFGDEALALAYAVVKLGRQMFQPLEGLRNPGGLQPRNLRHISAGVQPSSRIVCK